MDNHKQIAVLFVRVNVKYSHIEIHQLKKLSATHSVSQQFDEQQQLTETFIYNKIGAKKKRSFSC